MTEPRHNPFDDLRDHLSFCLGIAPGKVVETVAKVLDEHGIRVVIAAVSDDWPHPQVELTVTPDDVTAKVVSQVVDPVLRRVGVPPDSVLMFSVAAGEAAVRMFKRYRENVSRKTERKIRINDPAENRQQGQGPQEEFKPAWDPNKRRKG